MQFVEIVILLVVCDYLFTFPHEAGHALTAWWQGFAVTSCGIGFGRPLFVINFRGTKLYLCWTRPRGGMTCAYARGPTESGRQAIWITLGGSLANLACFVVCAVLYLTWPSARILTGVGAVVNLWIAVVNLLPFGIETTGTLPSDGAQLRRYRDTDEWRIANIRSYESLRPLWTAIGDRTSLWVHGLWAANDWIVLMWPERARVLLDEVEQLRREHPELDVTNGLFPARAALIRALIDVGLHREQEALVACEEAIATFAATGDRESHFFAVGVLGFIYLQMNDFAGAKAVASRLASDPLLDTWPDLKISVRDFDFHLALQFGGGDSRRLVEEFENTCRKSGGFHYTIARYHVQNQDDVAAARAFLDVLEEMRPIPGLLDENERRAWLARQGDWLAEARACFARQGSEVDLAMLDRWAEETPFDGNHNLQRDRSLFRLGVIVNAINAVMLFGSLAWGLLSGANWAPESAFPALAFLEGIRGLISTPCRHGGRSGSSSC
ncbi:MAG: site-2 protease family protein [Gemmataceae bacterium]